MALLNSLMIRIGVDPDGVRRGVNRANRELDRMRDQARRLSRSMGQDGEDGGRNFSTGFLKGFAKLGKGLASGAASMLKASAPVAAMGSALITLLPLLPGVVSGIGSMVSVSLAAAPALLALGAGALIVKTALTALFAEGTVARKALEPLGAMLTQARDAGSEAAAKGIRPLAEALRQVAQPTVTQFMQGVGLAANRVQKDFLQWAKSADGLKTLRDILGPLSGMVQGLAPHVSGLVISFARMLGRIMGVSSAMGRKGLAGALDWLSKKLDGVDAKSVSDALQKIASAGRTVMGVIRTVAGWIDKLVTAYRTYTTEFGLVADALAVVAIIFGGPITAAIAAAGIIVRHFDQIKAGWEKLKSAFSGGGGGGPLAKAFTDIKAAVDIVLPAVKNAFSQIWTAVAPVLRDLGNMIVNDLIPTFAEWYRAMAPVLAWLIGVLGPVVAATFKNILTIIKGVLNIIIGIVKVFIAIVTGDWGKAWQGICQIARGLGQILAAVVRQIVAVLKGIWNLLVGIVSAVWNRLKNIAISAAKALMSGAASAVRGGLGAVKSALNAIKNAVTGIFKGAGSWLVGAGKAILDGLVNGIRSAIGRVTSILSSVTDKIPDWKGPMRVDLKLLEPTGRAIMSGLTTGIRGSVPDVRGALRNVTADIQDFGSPGRSPSTSGWAQAQWGWSQAQIVVKSGGSRWDDALVEVLRRAIADKGGDVQKVLGR